MKKVLKLSENELINVLKNMVNEARYSPTANILRGNIRKSIKTIAILTAENPKGVEASKEYNKAANEKLKDVLRTGRFGYRPIDGSYGTEENSFIINNISLDDAINIGEKFKQDTIVFGEVVGGDDEKSFMAFKMVGTDPDKPKEYRKIIAVSDVFIHRKDAEDFYSEIGGRKFVLPFYGTIDKFVGEDDKVYKIEKDYSRTKWEGGKAEPTDIKISPDEDELNELQERAIRTCCSTSYNLRGRIHKIIKESYK